MATVDDCDFAYVSAFTGFLYKGTAVTYDRDGQPPEWARPPWPWAGFVMEEETTQDEFTVKFAAVCDECRGPLMESSTESGRRGSAGLPHVR